MRGHPHSPDDAAAGRPWWFALAGSFALAACGQPATEAQCNEIVERIARLEIEAREVKPVDLEGAVKAQTEKPEVRALMKDCVGKRITAEAMQCIRNAKTSRAIAEECLD
jgi:hypothetical protein